MGLCDLDEQNSHYLLLLATSGNFVLPARGIDVQKAHKDIEKVKRKLPCFLIIVTSSDGAFSYIYLGSFHFVLERGGKMAASEADGGGINIPLDSLFIGHDYVQNTEAKSCSKYFLRTHIYWIPESVQLKDTIAFTYGNGLRMKNLC